MDVRTLDPELGMGDCVPDNRHYHGASALAHLQPEISAEDAEDPAAGEVDYGKVQALQHYRSASPGDATGNVGTVQARRGESGRGLLPHAAADALPVCLLLHAGQRH